MTVVIMQPYFLPYLGYFQLMTRSDRFVVYDNIEYSRKGWINRNQILVNNQKQVFTLPLKKASDYLHVVDRFLADIIEKEKSKLLRKVEASYRKAPHFEATFQLFEKIVSCPSKNLFEFIFNSIQLVKAHLEIETELIVSSTVSIDHGLKAQDKVIAICQNLKAKEYLNPIGGMEIYQTEAFQEVGIELTFLKSQLQAYPQFAGEFVAGLSILDVMMFNSVEEVNDMLNHKFSLLKHAG